MTTAEPTPFVPYERIEDLVTYERHRTEVRQRMIAERALRRVAVGPFVTFHFESPETVWYQIQEMVRAERIVDEEAIRHEIVAYSDLLPTDHELSAVMMIALTSDELLREWLPKLIGIEAAITLTVGDERVPGKGEEGRSTDEVTSAVHYIRFPLTADQRRAIEAGATCSLEISHDNYTHRAEIPPETVAALAGDLGSVTLP